MTHEKSANAAALADEKLLSELGYKQEFKRAFTPLEVFGIAFSVIGVLPSIASVLFYAIPNGGGPAMVWGWLVASFFILFIGLSMAELASAAPTSGGLYFWTFSLAPLRWRNVLCWLVGYANTIGSVAAIASINWGCAVQIMALVTISSEGAFETTEAQKFGAYAAIMVTHGIICSLATAVLARLQSLYVVLNVLLCLVVLIALPIVTPAEFKNTSSFALKDFVNLSSWSDGFAFILSFQAPAWTICSFDSSVHISEEASNAATAVPWAIVLAIAVGGVLGWAINMSLAFCMGTDLQALHDSDQPMASIFLNGFGKNGTMAIWIVVVIIQYLMGTSMLLAASRQTFAFSRDGALPFSNWLYRMNSYTQTPTNTVWFCVFFSLVLGLLAFAGDQAINAVFAISVAGLYVAYATPIICRFTFDNDSAHDGNESCDENGVLKRRKWKSGAFNLGVFSLPVAIVAVLFMTFMFIVLLFPPGSKTNAEDMNYTVAVLGVVLGGSLIWYYFPKYGGVHWFTGPVSNYTAPAEGGHHISSSSTVDSNNIGSEKPNKATTEFVETSIH